MIETSRSSADLKHDALATVDQLDQGQRGVPIVFAILGDRRGKTVTNLPFFSRLSLVQASRRINQLAHVPSLELVGRCL
jgi:uncharacterized protein (TIGR04141 family)